jgi:drug/metabolite transporter (DMT)-like permease
MHWNSERIGIAYSILHMLLWGLFPVFAKYTFTSMSPLWSVGIGTMMASVVFALLISARRELYVLQRALRTKGVWYNTLFNGVLYYVLLYIGLRSTPAGNASIVAQFEVLTTIVLLGLVRHSERMTRTRITGSLLILIGVLIILLRNVAMPQGGELLILLATCIVPFGNLAGKDALRHLSAPMLLLVRNVVSSIVLCCIAWMVDGVPSVQRIAAALPVLLFTGIVLLGLSKILWMESMKRLQIALCTSIGSVAPVVTLIAGVLVLGEPMRLYHILSLPLVLIGIRMVLRPPKALRDAVLEI